LYKGAAFSHPKVALEELEISQFGRVPFGIAGALPFFCMAIKKQEGVRCLTLPQRGQLL